MFEIGKTYWQEYSNGDGVVFTPTERLKNGNWRGQAMDYPLNGRKRKPRTVVVFHPPIAAWQPYHK